MKFALISTVLLGLVLAAPAWCWWDFWPYLEHQDMLARSVEIAAERYPDMAGEIQSCQDQLLSGTHDEDFDSDETNGSYSDYSGYCPSVPDAWWPTARRHLNAIQWVCDGLNPNNWYAAVAAYPGSRSDAYYMLGHVIHNLQDLFVPAHAHISPHGLGTGGLVENHSWPGYFDDFEQWDEVTENELGRARSERIPEAPLETLMVRAALFSSTDVESISFYPSQYYAVPDSAGGWGRYRPYPSGGYPCGNDRIDNDLANAWSLYIVPACCEYAAAALRAFYLACNPTAVSESLAPGPRSLTPIPSPVSSRALSRMAFPAGTELYDRTGRRVTPVGLTPGVYICRMPRDGKTITRPLVVVGDR
jgi:hypothetical protein